MNIASRSENTPGEFLHVHMKRMVREEIRSVHLVLAVCKFRYPGNDLLGPLRWDYGQLPLDKHVLELIELSRGMDRCRGLPSVHNLQIEIGRASCRESVCQSVSISMVAATLKKKKNKL